MGRYHPAYLIVYIIVALVIPLSASRLCRADTDHELRLFVVEKSKNPQNILVVYAAVDAHCNVRSIPDAGGHHLFDLYWLMNRTTFKPTHRLIKRAARKRFVAQQLFPDSLSFDVLLSDLKELRHDLPTDRIRVEIHRDPDGNCQARVILPLGPSHANRTMAIDTIYSEANTFFGIPIGIHYIELRGKDIQNNAPIVARFSSREQNDKTEFTDKTEGATSESY